MQPGFDFATWSISLGQWLGVRVRINVWFPLILLLFAHWVGWKLGSVCTVILLVTVLIHEFAHVLAARLTGGEGDEIILWPLGGLAMCRPGETFASQFLTPAAGPISQIVLCLVTLPAVWQAGLVSAALHPAQLPISDFSSSPMRDVLILTFSLNWVLLLINLVPAYPLDGGQMVLAGLMQRLAPQEARLLSIRVGWIAGVVLAVGGLFADNTTVVFLGFFLIMTNLSEMFRWQIGEQFGEGSPAYGGLGGHESTESTDYELPTPRLSFWRQWKQNRAAARHERELEARAAAARRLDQLLDKVHRDGIDSLTAEERRFLDQASNQYRTQHGRKA